jgi:hypothetical protein
MSRSRSVHDFESERVHLTTFVKQYVLPLMENEEIRRILIRAPVKSGKREIVEYIAKRDESRDPHRVHAFLSAWHRISDEEQRKELANHNLKVFSVTSAKNKEECVKWIRSKLEQGKRIVLHLDECDFGTGSRQQLGTMYREFRDHPMILFILYSATPQEILLSGEVDEKEDELFDAMMTDMVHFGKHVEYTPPEGYCGPGRFLDEGLVFDAKPFFSCRDGFRLSPQALHILHQLNESIKEHPERNVIVLRLSSSDLYGQGDRKEKKQIYQFLKGAGTCAELQDVDIIVDKSEKDLNGLGVSADHIEWSNPKYWHRLASGIPIIFVIDQTASRSTEFACHHRMFAYHDFRHTAVYTTVSQAQERVNHYEQKYEGFQRIQIYGHKKTFECSAGRIDYAQYMTLLWKKVKIDKRRSPEERYEIKSTSDGSLHPIHQIPLTLMQADEILQDLSSYTEVKLSARVRGRIALIPVIRCDFMPCEPDQFGEKVGQLQQQFPARSFRNPFAASRKEGLDDGKWKGYLRQWKVFQFEEVETQIWGMDGTDVRLTICYKGGILGLSVRYNTGERQEVNSLMTFKSMYKA